MKVKSYESEPASISLNGAPPTTMKQKLTVWKIANEKDMCALAEEMTKGRDIMSQVQTGIVTYALLREFIPMKIAIPSSPGGFDPNERSKGI